MSQDTKDDFLLSLINTLAGNQAETASITKALELICSELSFGYGLVYETDLSGCFCLMGQYNPNAVNFPSCLSGEFVMLQEHIFSEQKEICYFIDGKEQRLFDQELLALYNVQSLALAPVLDEESSLYGLIVLLAPASESLLASLDKSVFSAAFSLLSRYIGTRMYHKKLSQAQITLESILDNTGIDIYVNDFYTHEILYVNKSMAVPYGGREAFMGQKCWQTLFPGQTGPCEFCPQSKLIDDQGLPTKVYTWDYQRAFDGSWFRVFSAAFHWVDGRIAHVVSSADITDNKRNEALIENLANYDQLTKLPNRRMLMKECKRRIDNATALEQGYVMFFDIDGFKAINDNFGHDAGDEFLIQLGEFFSNIPILHNSIYRNGGDEFVAVVGGEQITKAHIQSLAGFIHERFKKPWILKKGEVLCGTSIGIACYPEDGMNAEVLLQKADMAMYQVKKSGGGGSCFGYQMTNNPLMQ